MCQSIASRLEASTAGTLLVINALHLTLGASKSIKVCDASGNIWHTILHTKKSLS